MRIRLTVTALLFASALAFAPAASAGKGKLGFGVDATTSGVDSPTLDMVKIKDVKPASPAAAAGMKPGDQIIELDGVAIEGSPASAMYEKLSKLQVGDRVRLKLLRGDKSVQMEIVAGG